jgi:hypothetical protein
MKDVSMSKPDDLFPASVPPSAAPAPEAAQGDEPMSEALKRWMVRRDRLSEAPLAAVLEHLGGVQNRTDRSKWKIEGVGNIIFKGKTWLNGNLNVPGFGAVSLVNHIMDTKDTPSMKWLAERFPDLLDGDWTPAEEEEKEIGFRPPERADEFIDPIRDYLVGSRGLPAELVDAEISAGRIFATEHRSKDEETGAWTGDQRVVFIGPSSAELRSIDPDGFKGCCPGSDSERSGYQVMFRGQSDGRLGIVEAAIDALSYNAMYPGRYVFSTNGSGRFHLQLRLTLESWRNDFSTDIATDADPAGDQAAQLIFNALYLRDYLSKQHEVSPEQVDDWLLNNRITFQPTVSPHTQFFS